MKMMKTKEILINAGIPAVVFAAFVFLLGILGAASVALIALLLVRTCMSMYGDFQNPRQLVQTKAEKRKKDYILILIYVLAVRIAVYLFTYIVARINGGTANLSDAFFRIWQYNGTDADHYIGLAKNWYVTEGDPQFHIVFFPFFPILLRLFSFIFGDMLLSATILNLLLSFGIGIAAYELALLYYDRKTALRFVKYIFIIPAAFFYAAPMTESTFVLLSLLCLLFAKRKQFALCALFGALAAFTRSQGAILMLPCGYMALREYILNRKNKGEFMLFVGRAACVLCISCGLIAYLLINYLVWGNPFKFAQFQWEHWHQKLGFFGETARTIEKYALEKLNGAQVHSFSDSSFRAFISLWIPQAVYILAAPLIVLCKTGFAGKETAKAETETVSDAENPVDADETVQSDTVSELTEEPEAETEAATKEQTEAPYKLDTASSAYFLAYYVISIGATWLLSAPRYLMACIPLPLALALMSRKKTADIIITFVCILLGGLFLYMFAKGGYIY